MLFPLDIVRGRDTLSEWISLTHVTPAGIPVDDLTRLVGAPCWTQYHKDRILAVVPMPVSVGFRDGHVLDFISKERAKA